MFTDPKVRELYFERSALSRIEEIDEQARRKIAEALTTEESDDEIERREHQEFTLMKNRVFDLSGKLRGKSFRI